MKLDFSDIPQGLGAKIAYNDEREEWLIVVFRKSGKTIEVLSVGCEGTEEAADRWADGTLDLMRQTGRDDVELPDKYERARAH